MFTKVVGVFYLYHNETELGGNIKQVESIPFLREVDCFVLLNDDPSHCKSRVEEQRRFILLLLIAHFKKPQ